MSEINEQERREDERIRALAEGYNRPADPPRERMWAAIQATRTKSGAARPGYPRRWAAWITGLAAVLLLGIGIGRFTATDDLAEDSPASGGPVATTPRETGGGPSVALTVATTQHLSQVETFLTAFRTAESNGSVAGQARDLLTSTRLLLDSRAVEDVRVRTLLEDLELILIQIVRLGGADRPEEMDLINDGLAERQVMPRLRTAIPAGPAHTPGAS